MRDVWKKNFTQQAAGSTKISQNHFLASGPHIFTLHTSQALSFYITNEFRS